MSNEDLLTGIREIIREELVDFKEEMYEFREEMYEFREEMYEFREEMYGFRDEMYGFKAKTEDDIAIIKRAVLELSSDMKEMKNHTHKIGKPVQYKIEQREVDYISEEANNE